MTTQRRHLFAFLFMATIAFAVVFGFQQCSKKTPKTFTGSAGERRLTFSPGQVGEGIRIDEYLGGEKVFTLKMDNVGVRGKKAAFLRLGFWKVAKLEGVSLDVYGPARLLRKGSTSQAASMSEKVSGSIEGYDNIKDLFTRNSQVRKLLPGKIKGVEIDGFRVRIYENGQLESSLSSSHARMGFGDRPLVFEGNVELAAGNGRRLSCGELHWASDEGKFRTTGEYVLEDDGRTIKGQGIETDYRLEAVESSGRKR